MGAGHRKRRTARRTAIDVLYQADVTGQPASHVVEQWRQAGRAVPAYATELVAGVEKNLLEIDRLLEASSEEWPVHRMAVVDRTILRVACYELRAGEPVAVAISEAVGVANELSTEDSGRFINGVLGKIGRGLQG